MALRSGDISYDQYRALMNRAKTSDDPAELTEIALITGSKWNHELQRHAIKNPSITADALRVVRQRQKGAWCWVAIMAAPAALDEVYAQIGDEWAPLPRGAFSPARLITDGKVEIRGDAPKALEYRRGSRGRVGAVG